MLCREKKDECKPFIRDRAHSRRIGVEGLSRSAARHSTRFQLFDECSKMRGGGSREGVVLVLEALPNC